MSDWTFSFDLEILITCLNRDVIAMGLGCLDQPSPAITSCDEPTAVSPQCDGEIVCNVFVPKPCYIPDTAGRQLGLQVYSAIFTASELAEAVNGLPLSLVKDDSVYDYEQRHPPEGGWPPTSW